jgi:phosphate transport system substrate-binding protein
MKRLLTVAALALALAAMGLGQTINIIGAGATFPAPMYTKWFDEYHKANPKVQINYGGGGSGAGIRQVTEGTVDFGASDGPMSDDQMKDFQTKRGSSILHFPTVIGAVIPIYNIPGVTGDLNFTGEALAGIYLGKITKWNDPAIASVNSGVKLPANDIVVVHRAESSGTTYIWTDYLSKVSPEWEKGPGKAQAPKWPVGLSGQGSDGVSGQVKQVPNAIGYVELTYALQNKMSYGKVKNKSGAFIKADLGSVTAAASGVTMPDDFRVSITDSAGKTAYPISSFTWLLIPEQIKDANKKQVLTDFLKWMVGPGQKMTEVLSFASLPAAVVTKETKAIAKIH